jgi:YVTN family beta-propeller protein
MQRVPVARYKQGVPLFALILAAILIVLSLPLCAQYYAPPAGERPAIKRLGAESILPGGRIITPLGRQYSTGAGPFGVAVSPNGKRVATADGGKDRYSITVLAAAGPSMRRRQFEAPRNNTPEGQKNDWRSVFLGIAFDGNGRLYVSEGNSGQVRLVSASNGRKIRGFDLNQGGFRDSYSAGLALDARKRRLYVVDQANFRLAVFDTRNGRVLHSIPVGRLPLQVSLSPDRRFAYVTNQGMFRYQPVPGADPQRAKETGLDFPAFGFPSKEAKEGVTRQTESGEVNVPGLGDPNVPESNSVTVVDLSNAAEPRATVMIRTGLPFGGKTKGGSSPGGVLATETHVYVTNGHNDTISVIDRDSNAVTAEIPLRIPGLENLRGVMPIGMTIDPQSGLLYVAEAGINAVAVVDPQRKAVLGHLPVGWFPSSLEIHKGTLYVANAKGHGTGPNASREEALARSFQADIRHGTVSVIPLPSREQLDGHTQQVLANNGFLPLEGEPEPIPDELKYVVLIIKENRTYDEVFGDIQQAANGAVNGAPGLARFGSLGYAEPERTGLISRGEIRDVPITPNHHALARRFAFSDNFYCDSEVSVDGHHWAIGSYPNIFTESSLMASYGGQKDFRMPTQAPGRLIYPQSNSSLHPEEQLEAGALWHHLEDHGVSFRNFGEGFELAGVDEGKGLKPTGARVLTNVPMPDPLYRNTSRNYPGYNMNIPDQYRATQFINEIEELYRRPGKDLPRLLYIHLPNDHMDRPRPEDGYPFRASFVADNDIALGRIVEYLSSTPWWKQMAIMITEDDAQGGVDHVDSHRSIMLVVSPFARRNYVSRRNVSMPGMLKTAFRILNLPPLNLYDATAQDLADCFTESPDFSPYKTLLPTKLLFDPELAKEPLDPQPSPPMDHPEVLRQDHQRIGNP